MNDVVLHDGATSHRSSLRCAEEGGGGEGRLDESRSVHLDLIKGLRVKDERLK